MSKALTIRTDEALYEKLEALAEATDRSRNYLANEALRAFLGGASVTSVTKAPVVTDAEDLAGDFWLEDDADDFLAYLEEERRQSLKDDLREDT